MDHHEREHYRRLETRSRRKIGEGVLHPDRCGKLTLHGVDFAIPPRGLRIAPEFRPDGAGVSIAGLDDWPEAARLLELATTKDGEACPACGRPLSVSIEVDVERNVAFLAASFDLAGRLLDRQYELTDGQKAELLAFGPDRPPEWMVQLLHWCRALPMTEN